jgi:hypothetical protein
VTDDVNGHGIRMLASLFEHKPSVCPFGHDLAPGRVSVGFSPCVCALAREAAAHGGSMGHLRLHCLACEGEGRSSIFLEPPCDVRHREQLGGWQLTRDPAVPPPPQAADAGRLRLHLEVIDSEAPEFCEGCSKASWACSSSVGRQ